MFYSGVGSRHRPCASEGLVAISVRKSTLLRKSNSEEPITSDELQSCFKELLMQTKQVTDWQKCAWKDLSEDLKLMGAIDAERDSHTVDTNSDLTEGLFAAIRQTVAAAKSQVNSFCFRCRGKYSETECKKGVSGALDKMAGDLWQRMKVFAQQSPDTRLYETFQTAMQLDRVAETLRSSLLESVASFSVVLGRYLSINCPPTPTRRHISFVSELSEDASSDEGVSIDISGEIIEESSKLLAAFQRFSASGSRDGYRTSLKSEMERVMKDMETALRTSREDTDRLDREAQGQKVDRHLAAVRSRIASICSELEELTTRLPSTEEIISNLRTENRHLESTVISQAEELRKLKENNNQRHDKDPMIALQSSILAEVLDMKKMMETSRGVVVRRRGEELTQVVAVMRSALTEIEGGTDTAFLEKCAEELTKARESARAFLSALAMDGFAAPSLDAALPQLQRLKRENESLRQEVEEVLLKSEQLQKESSLEIEYLESRIRSLEDQKEEKIRALLAFSEPQSPTARLDTSCTFEGDSLANCDDTSLQQRFEATCKDRARLIAHVNDLQSALHLSEEQVFAYRHLYGELPRSSDFPLPFYESESDEDALSLKISIALEMLRTRSHDVTETLQRLIESLRQVNSMKRKAFHEEVTKVLERLRKVAGQSMENFVETRKAEGQIERLEAVMKAKKLSVRFSEY